MPIPNTLTVCKEHLFSDVDEMQRAGIPDIVRNRVIRIRDTYNHWLLYPSKADKDIAQYVMKNREISKSTAYEDIRIVKYFLGHINKTSKDYARWKFNEMALETYAMAKDKTDLKVMRAATDTYGKYNMLDKEDPMDYGFDEIKIQTFEPTDDPTAIGIKPIPNLRKVAAELKKKYLGEFAKEDAEEIEYTSEDYHPEELFGYGEEAKV